MIEAVDDSNVAEPGWHPEVLAAGLPVVAVLCKPRAEWPPEAWSEGGQTRLPFCADAVFGPKHLEMNDGNLAIPPNTQRVRRAAMYIDLTRGRVGNEDLQRTRDIWRSLVRGDMCVLDWFDTDTRRYVLVKPNTRNPKHTQALSKRERQIVAYATLGQSHKLIACQLGISRARVTNTLHAAMRKLGVKNQAQLIAKLRGMQLQLPKKPPRSRRRSTVGKASRDRPGTPK